MNIPTIVSGFWLPDANLHAPNERLPVAHVDLGIAVAKELFTRFAALPKARPEKPGRLGDGADGARGDA
jgi:hypothetical protein